MLSICFASHIITFGIDKEAVAVSEDSSEKFNKIIRKAMVAEMIRKPTETFRDSYSTNNLGATTYFSGVV